MSAPIAQKRIPHLQKNYGNKSLIPILIGGLGFRFPTLSPVPWFWFRSPVLWLGRGPRASSIYPGTAAIAGTQTPERRRHNDAAPRNFFARTLHIHDIDCGMILTKLHLQFLAQERGDESREGPDRGFVCKVIENRKKNVEGMRTKGTMEVIVSRTLITFVADRPQY